MKKILYYSLPWVIFAVAPTSASIIYVEVPSDIGNEQIWQGDTTTADTLEALINHRLQEFASKTKDTSGVDIIIKFVRNGNLIPPDTMKLKSEGWGIGNPPGGDLTPKRGDGWTDTEWSDVADHFDLAESKIKEVYGSPFRTVDVKIHKDLSLPYAGLFIPSCWGGESNIKLKGWGTDYWRGVLTHEMIHAFRDDWCCAWDQFEEGMTEAMTVEVQTRIYETWGEEGNYSNLYHRDPYRIYPMHQLYNTPFVGTNSPHFIGGIVDGWIRYRVGSYAWWKVFRDDQEFMKDFNEDLFNSAWWWPSSQEYGFYRDLAIDNFNGGQIEGIDFETWFNNNPILRNNFPMWNVLVPELIELGVTPDYGTSQLFIYYYWRWFNVGTGEYEEKPLENKTISIKVWDWTGGLVYQQLISMGPQGVKSLNLSALVPGGRYKIEVYPTEYANPSQYPWLFNERIWYFDDTPKNFFGAVGAETKITVYVDTWSGWAENGIFSQDFVDYSGERRIYYDSRFLGHMESKAIKDKALYHIYPGGLGKVPPAQPQNVVNKNRDRAHF